VLPPIVRLERHRAPSRGHGIASVADAVLHERQRAPCLTRGGFQPAALARVMRGLRERSQIRLQVRARGFETKHARVGEADVGRDKTGGRAQGLLERLPRARHRRAIEGFERGAPVQERPIRIQHDVERRVRLPSRSVPIHRSKEPVALSHQRLNVRRTIRLVAKRLPKPPDGLDQIVVPDGDAPPRHVRDLVLGHDAPRLRHQQQQHIQLAVRQPHRLALANEAPTVGIELERAEPVERTSAIHRARCPFSLHPWSDAMPRRKYSAQRDRD
jgi:hypothetical protein